MTDQGIRAAAIATRLGVIHLAATDDGLAAVELLVDRATFMAGLRRRFGLAPVWRDDPGSDPVMGPAAAALARAAEGDGSDLAEIPVDLADRPAWDRSVLGAVRSIPWGQTRGYGDIARMVGRPGAARAVGGAVGRNPLALVIPCHRVIAGDGTLGGYGGGWWGYRDRLLDLKEALLLREGRSVPRGHPTRTTRP